MNLTDFFLPKKSVQIKNIYEERSFKRKHTPEVPYIF